MRKFAPVNLSFVNGDFTTATIQPAFIAVLYLLENLQKQGNSGVFPLNILRLSEIFRDEVYHE